MSCDEILAQWLPGGSPPAVLLSYATALPPDWLLGLTSALYSVPLVLIGLGKPWNGLDDKYHGTLLAARVLGQSAARDSPLVFADAWDTMLVNDPAKSAPLRALRGAAHPRTLLSSECNSWPRCYAADFARDAALAKCLADERRTCNMNSGIYAASSAAALEALLPRVIAGLNASVMHPIEVMHDQAAMIRLFLARATNGLRARLHLDWDSTVFLSLFPCKGRGAVRNLGRKGAQYCHARAHEPLSRVWANGSATSYRAAPATAERDTQWPLVAHANGNAEAARRLEAPVFAPLRARLRPPSEALRRHPVLLLDSKDGGACSLSSIGALAAAAARSGDCRSHPVCRGKIK
jgi:hypothetical protein